MENIKPIKESDNPSLLQDKHIEKWTEKDYFILWRNTHLKEIVALKIDLERFGAMDRNKVIGEKQVPVSQKQMGMVRIKAGEVVDNVKKAMEQHQRIIDTIDELLKKV